MIDLSIRSNQKELMDGDNIPFDAMALTLKELNIINTRLGGHAITIRGMKSLLRNKQSISVCEIGCGGGDNLNAIYKYCRRKNIDVSFIGIDINPECIAFAKKQYPDLPCQWICSDYALGMLPVKPDAIFSSLFCHHFTNTQLVSMMRWMRANSSRGFFINDLHRHWLAYYLIKYITKFFSRSYLVRNDACISVARGFRISEWKKIFSDAEIEDYTIKWKWAFRFLVTSKN